MIDSVGNSGVYLQERYEIQVLDSYGLAVGTGDCGGVYRVAAPMMEPVSERAVTITLNGGETCVAGLSVVRRKHRKLGKVKIKTEDGKVLRPDISSSDFITYHVPAKGQFQLIWE